MSYALSKRPADVDIFRKMADDAMVIFHACDTNGDGVLSPLELSTRLSDFGMSDDQVRRNVLSRRR